MLLSISRIPFYSRCSCFNFHKKTLTHQFCVSRLSFNVISFRYQSSNASNEATTSEEEKKNQRKQEIHGLEEALRNIRAREQALLALVMKYKYGIETDSNNNDATTTTTPNEPKGSTENIQWVTEKNADALEEKHSETPSIIPSYPPFPTSSTTTTSTLTTATTIPTPTPQLPPPLIFTSSTTFIPPSPASSTSATSNNLVDSDTAKTPPSKTTMALLLEMRDVAPDLYDIMNWPETRIAKESEKVQKILKEHNDVFVDFLKKLYEQGHFKSVREYYEKFGANNVQGEALSIYLSSLNNESILYEKISKIFKDQPPGSSSNNPLYVHVPIPKWYYIVSILGLILSAAFLFFLFRSIRGGGGINSMLNTTYTPVDKSQSTVTFVDVKGNHEAKEELQDLVHFLKDPNKFANVKVPKGVLMVGPPGTGKTLMARALAGEAGVPFITASGSEFEEIFVGMGARRIRQLFQEAKKHSPCIIFIDEIDAVGGNREKFFKTQQMSLNQLLVELDGFKSSDGIILIGATNMPSALDPALVRPGRFDRKIYLDLPGALERKEILDYYLSKHKLAEDVNSSVLSRQTAGMSGADIENMVNWAVVESIKQDRSNIDMHLLEVALWNVTMGREKKSMILTDKVKRITAYHEGGHAIVALYSPGAPEIRKATLIPRGEALGMVNYLPSEEHLVTKTELLGQMQMAMGGRAAEELIFGQDNITSGASSDFEGATNIATAMVTKLGMSDKIGHVHVKQETDLFGRTYTGNSDIVEQEVKRLIEDAYGEASKLLKEKEGELHLLANALLQYETLDKEEIKKVVKGEPLVEKDEQLKRDKETKAEKERIKKELDTQKELLRNKEEVEALEMIKQKQKEKEKEKEKTI